MSLFKKILVANRGEIALRIIRACRELSIPSVAVYSQADRTSLHVLLADEAYAIGPALSLQSYLNIERLMEVACRSGADAVHPGYGFLSENVHFVRAVKEAGLTFIGPSPENIELMGDKMTARQAMAQAGVRTVPGSKGIISDEVELKRVAREVGFPIMIKATAGGGGKGMRVVQEEKELVRSYRAAQSEAKNYFNNEDVYVERYIANPKHIEVQVFGDMHGHVCHLYERECSIQRRHQKLLEESPSMAVPEFIRQKMGEVSVEAAQSIGYMGPVLLSLF